MGHGDARGTCVTREGSEHPLTLPTTAFTLCLRISPCADSPRPTKTFQMDISKLMCPTL